MKVHAKRLLSVVCLLAMLLSLVPMSAMAEEVAEVPVFDETDGSAVLMAMNELNFTASGKIEGNSFFTVKGNNQSSAGSVSVTVNGNNLTLTKAMKFETSNGTVTFNATEAGTLTAVVALSDGASGSGKSIKVDGKTVNVGSDGHTVTIDLATGSHTVAKGSGSLNLYYISYGSNCEHVVFSVPVWP